MIIALFFATAAFAASVLTTILSLARAARTIALRIRELAGLERVSIDPIEISAIEIGHAMEDGGLDFTVVRIEAKDRRIWTRPSDFDSARAVIEKRATNVVRTRTLELSGELFAAGSILSTYDPRPSLRMILWSIRGAILGVLASAIAALALAHLSGYPEVGALWCLAHFLLVPVLENRIRAAIRAPDDAGRVFVEKSFA